MSLGPFLFVDPALAPTADPINAVYCRRNYKCTETVRKEFSGIRVNMSLTHLINIPNMPTRTIIYIPQGLFLSSSLSDGVTGYF